MIVRIVFCMLWMPRSKRQHSCLWVAYLISKAMEYAIWAQDNKEPAQPRWNISRVKDRELKRYSYSKPLYIWLKVLRHGLLEKESNMSLVVLWEVECHARVRMVWWGTDWKQEDHTWGTQASVFLFFPMGTMKCTFMFVMGMKQTMDVK